MNHQEINLFLVSTKADILEHNGSQATYFLNPPIQLDQNTPMYLSLLEANVVFNEPNIIKDVNNKIYFKSVNLLGQPEDFICELDTGLYSLEQINDELSEFIVRNCGKQYASQFEFEADTATSKSSVTFKRAAITSEIKFSIDCIRPNNLMTTLGFASDQVSVQGATAGILTVNNIGESVDSKNKIELNKLKSYIVTCNLVSNSYMNDNTGNAITTFVPKIEPWSVYTYEPRHLTHLKINRNNIIDKITITFYTQDMEYCDLTGGNAGSTPETFIVRLRISSQISN